MTPTGRVIHKYRMQFPRHRVAPRIHIVGIATFVDAVESSFNRIACETAASARAACAPRRARGPDGMRLGSLIRAWVQHLACGPAIAGAGPLIRAWAAPRRISRGWRACRGVNAHCRRFACERRTSSGAVAPTTQTTLPATPPLSAFVIEVVCDVGGAAPRRDIADSKLWDLRCTGTRV